MKKFYIVTFLFLFFINSYLLSQVTIMINATQPWTDTGIDISPGDIITINAYGRYLEANAPNNPINWIGPDGYPYPTSYSSNSSSYPIPEAAARCLIGKINNGDPFIVASRYIDSFLNDGRLYLGLNDINFGNNYGYLIAFVAKINGFANPIKVDITQPWTDTGLDVKSSDKVVAISYGIYNEGGITSDIKNWLGPSGHPTLWTPTC